MSYSKHWLRSGQLWRAVIWLVPGFLPRNAVRHSFFFHFHKRNNHSSRKHYSICDISYAALSKIATSNGDVSIHAFTPQKENQNWIKNGAMIISNTQRTPSERLSRFSLIGMPHFLWNVASDQVPNTPEFSTFSATTRVRNVKTCFVVLPKPWYFSRRLYQRVGQLSGTGGSSSKWVPRREFFWLAAFRWYFASECTWPLQS